MHRKCQRLVLILAIGLGACQSTLHVDVRFEDGLGLRGGEAVRLDQTKVGRVDAVTGDADGVVVSLALASQQVAELRSGAAAMIIQEEGKRYVQLFNSGTGGRVTGGETLLGLNSAIEYLAWTASDAIDRTHAGLSIAAQTLHEYLASDEWQQRKQEMEQDLSRLGESLRELGESAERDFEELTRQLEKESERAAEHYQALASELAKAIAELNRRGQEELAESLDRLLQELDGLLKRRSLPEEKSQQRT